MATRNTSTRRTTNKKPTTKKSAPARSTKRAKKTVAPLVIWAPRTPTQEQIAARAYKLWLRRGGIHGHHLEDWLTAETELMTGFIFPPL